MANSTDQAKTAQLKRLEFALTFEIRDAIVGNLMQHTKFLSGLTVNEDAREAMQKANNYLVAVLMNLPMKVDGRSNFESHIPDDLNEILLNLNWQVRSRIVDTLIINHNIATLEGDLVASDFRSQLIDDNNDLCCELLKLKTQQMPKCRTNMATNVLTNMPTNMLTNMPAVVTNVPASIPNVVTNVPVGIPTVEEINKLIVDSTRVKSKAKKPREDAEQAGESAVKRARSTSDEVCTNQQQTAVQSRTPSPLLNRLNWSESKQSQGMYFALVNRRQEGVGNTQVNGFLKLDGLKLKTTQRSEHYAVKFVVVLGIASVAINDNPPVIYKTKDAFKVDKNMMYSIGNLQENELVLNFAIQGKDQSVDKCYA